MYGGTNMDISYCAPQRLEIGGALIRASFVGPETLPDDLPVYNVSRYLPLRVKQFVDQRLNEDILQDILYDAFIF